MFKSLKDYVVGAYQELRKVTWLTRKQAVSHTIIVLVVSVIVSLFIVFFDFIFQTVQQYLFNNL